MRQLVASIRSWIRDNRAPLIWAWFVWWVLPVGYAAMSGLGGHLGTPIGLEKTVTFGWDWRVLVVPASAALLHSMIREENEQAVALGVALLAVMLLWPNLPVGKPVGEDESMQLLWLIAVTLSVLLLTYYRPTEDAFRALLKVKYHLMYDDELDPARAERLAVGEQLLRALRDGDWHSTTDLYFAGHVGVLDDYAERKGRVERWLHDLAASGDVESSSPVPESPPAARRWRLINPARPSEEILVHVPWPPR